MADEHNPTLQSVPTMVTDRDDENSNVYNDFNPGEETKLATVKMLLDSVGQTVTVAFPLRAPINELILYFAKELRMPANVLQIIFNGKLKNYWRFSQEFSLLRLDKVLDNQLNLSQIEVEPNTTVSMGLLLINSKGGIL